MKHFPSFVLFSALLALPAAASDSNGAVTYHGTVAPILQRQCVACHRAGEIGPFPLGTYAEARKRARQIAEVVSSREMPPWHADADSPPFLNERRLTDSEIAQLVAWNRAGAPEGNPARARPAKASDRLQIENPDATITMSEPFVVPAEGRDIYRNFVFPLHTTDDKWIEAIELRPSARSVVHHVLVFIDTEGLADKLDAQDPGPGFGGFFHPGIRFLVAWAPGAGALKLPPDLSWRFPKGSSLVLQTHLHPSGKEEREATTIRVKFAQSPPQNVYQTVHLPPTFGILKALSIPAGSSNYTVRDSFTMPIDADAFAIGGHAHYLGKRMKMTARFPDGTEKLLLKISDWDFAWQEQYFYKERIRLPRGTVLSSEVIYDNTPENPRNPSHPPRPVHWGEQSNDEMGSVIVGVVPVRNEEMPQLERALENHIAEQMLELALQGPQPYLPRDLRNGMERLAGAMKIFDKDKDGKLDETERGPLLGIIKSMGIPHMMLSAAP